jgi:hypothetical protein
LPSAARKAFTASKRDCSHAALAAGGGGSGGGAPVTVTVSVSVIFPAALVAVRI